MIAEVSDGILDTLREHHSDLQRAAGPLESKVKQATVEYDNIFARVDAALAEANLLSSENLSRLLFSEVDSPRLTACCGFHERQFYKLKGAAFQKLVSFLVDETQLADHASQQIQKATATIQERHQAAVDALRARQETQQAKLKDAKAAIRARARELAAAEATVDSLRSELAAMEKKATLAGVDEARLLFLKR